MYAQERQPRDTTHLGTSKTSISITEKRVTNEMRKVKKAIESKKTREGGTGEEYYDSQSK